MRPLAEQDHYEVLDVPRDASPEDIERAYRVAQATYADDSLALYSVFGEEDAAALRQRVEAAHSVLSSREMRRAYDAWLAGDDAPVSVSTMDAPLDSDLASETMALRTEPAPAPRPLPPLTPFVATGGEDVDDLSGPVDGTRLRQTRLRRGLELEQIASVTKINPTYLRFLEDERFDDLPAAVYVRGFVVAYLRCLGIDPAKGAAEYMARYGTGRLDRKNGRTPVAG
jgi:flagellar biosynthesis protein FlhG